MFVTTHLFSIQYKRIENLPDFDHSVCHYLILYLPKDQRVGSQRQLLGANEMMLIKSKVKANQISGFLRSKCQDQFQQRQLWHSPDGCSVT